MRVRKPGSGASSLSAWLEAQAGHVTPLSPRFLPPMGRCEELRVWSWATVPSTGVWLLCKQTPRQREHAGGLLGQQGGRVQTGQREGRAGTQLRQGAWS